MYCYKKKEKEKLQFFKHMYERENPLIFKYIFQVHLKQFWENKLKHGACLLFLAMYNTTFLLQ